MEKQTPRRRIQPESIERILIQGANWVGDALMTTPAISCVRAAFPKASLSILATPRVAGVYHGHPCLDRLIPYERIGSHRGTTGKRRLARELREEHFDLAVLFPNSFESALLAFWSRIPMRVGYEADGRGAMLTHGISRGKSITGRHQVGYYLGLPHSLGWRQGERGLSIAISREDEELAERLLAERGWKEGQRLMAIAPGASYGPAKKWDLSRYARVADVLVSDYHSGLIIVGSARDKSDAEVMIGKMRGKAWDLTGETTLGALAALLLKCDLLLTNDSGAMHVAAATQTPIIALFGSTDPARTSPYGVRHRLLRHEVDCSPCLLRECPKEHPCMKGIKVDEVLSAVSDFLETDGMRQRGGAGIAVFLDRDGTINEEVGYLSRTEDLQLIPGALEAVRLLNQHGLKAVVVSNQSGVARGYLTVDDVRKINEGLQGMLAEGGAYLDGIYFCPHHPEEGGPPYRAACDCRKPKGGMLQRAARDLHLDLSKSYVIGDHLSDVTLGKKAGMKAILVLTGHGREQLDKIIPHGESYPDLVSGDLYQAIQWILRDLKEG